MNSSVIIFPGSNCDRDMDVALKKFGFKNKMVWHDEIELPKSDLVVLPGGFSYGDYLRCGSIASKSKIIKSVINFAKSGGLVLGICNGFQILIETELLPGTLLRNKYLEFIKLCINSYECKFFLATGKKIEEQEILKKILNSNFKNYCKALDDLTISETLPIIKNCNLAVCNDTSFSHLSAALEIETIVLMTDSPLLYGSYSPKMHPIIPDGEKTVTHNTLGKDKINPEKIFNKMKEILKLS